MAPCSWIERTKIKDEDEEEDTTDYWAFRPRLEHII
jgi:hypothetical protein